MSENEDLCNEYVKTIVEAFRDNEVGLLIKHDRVIKICGQEMYRSKAKHPSKKQEKKRES